MYCSLDLLGDGLAIGHLRLAHGAFDAELRAHAVQRHLQMQLAHAAQDGLARSRGRSRDAAKDRRGPSCRARLPNFSCSALTFALTDTLMTGSGKRMRSSTTGLAVSQSVSPVSVSRQGDERDDVAGASLLDRIGFLGKHLDHAADLFALAARGVLHRGAPVQRTATAELLCGVPLAESATVGELTTPTGAAILATLADAFGPLPAMTIERIGYGAGQKDFAERPNILRLMLGEAAEAPAADADQVCVLETNLDDISGELVGYCTTRLWELGVLDVFTTAIQMKKNRPGVKLTVLCRPGDAVAVEDVLFRETTTLGVRRWMAARAVLRREPHTVTTPWGPVEGKVGWQRERQPRFAPEFESCRRLAEARGLPLREVYEAAQKAFDAGKMERGTKSES